MKVVVTGSSGFIGRELCKALLKEPDTFVYGLDRVEPQSPESQDSFRFQRIDLSSEQPELSLLKDTDLVFHLAANPEVRIGVEDTDVDYLNNVVATRNLLESLKRSHFHGSVVFASTSTVYGEATVVPTPESYGPLVPISMYGGSKLACEALVSSYAKLFDFRARIIRFANVVGGSSRHGVIYDFVNKLRRDPKKLEILGDGTQSKSYVHISDCVNGLLISSELGGSVEIFNLGTLETTNVRKIAEIVIGEMKLKDVEIKTGGGTKDGRGWPGDVKKMLLDCGKIRSLGWMYRFSSDEAITMAARNMIKRHV
ncbi:MAG: NAD-dependent epimerase/dehydratase family protein [Nitrososphaerota archaeon]|nr:NAD-dependent epimerase/dehydratase family protein [Nitrososphaerota archaeon]